MSARDYMAALDAYLDVRDAYSDVRRREHDMDPVDFEDQETAAGRALGTARCALEREVEALKMDRMDVKGDFNLNM